MNEKIKSLASKIVILILGVLAIGSAVVAFSGSSQVEIETCDGCLFGASQGEELGASGTRFPNGISADSTSPSAGEVRGTTLTVTGQTDLQGAFSYHDTQSALTATTTLVEADSGETFLISGGLSTWTLPASTTIQAGTKYTFRVDGDLTVSSTIVTGGNENTIEGSLIVAGAVVVCDVEDTITFGASFEDIGDYVELIWTGTYWLIGDSSTRVASALACST